MADNTELTEELLDYEEDDQQAPAADEQAAGDTKKVKGNSSIMFSLSAFLTRSNCSFTYVFG